MKRYNLVIPHSLYDETHALAEAEGATVLELFRRFIRMGILITTALKRPHTHLILREEPPNETVKEREIIMV